MDLLSTLRDADRGRRNLAALGDLAAPLMPHLARLLPRNADPDMALNNLERYLAGSTGRMSFPALIEGRARTLETVLYLFGTSQLFADTLVAYPDALDLVRGRKTPSFTELERQLHADIDAALDDAALLRAFRRFRQRQTLRIGVADVIRDRPLDEITRDISRVAEVAVEAALAVAMKQCSARYGEPEATCVVLAFGKFGGEELNYSSDIDLMFVYSRDGVTRGRRSVGHDEFYGRVVSEVVRLLSARTPHGQAYRVDLRLRPEGDRGPLARSLPATLSYYDAMGRTWERQALIKVRPVAGDLDLGAEFLREIEPFVYRKYFSFSEINEVKALKRKIERKVSAAGVGDTEVKTGRGGIRDIEFVVQFLQLLNGGDLPDIRQRNTLAALQSLSQAGCLTDQEYQILDDTYRFLRKTEHRLQLLFDLQTHRLPDTPEELRKLARRMGYKERQSPPTAVGGTSPRDPPTAVGGLSGAPQARRRPQLDEIPHEKPLTMRPLLIDPLDAFLHDYQGKTRLNRTILDHLLHSSFEGTDEDGLPAPEADLVLDPNPDEATIQAVLGRYGFRDVRGAYQNLVLLARESVPFLSARRCRHFLASIAPRMLREVADTPDPDLALINLEKVTASLGAKAILWELFSFNAPSLKLYVDLCAGSQFLAEVLINNPGMIDELLDSLVLNRPRAAAELREELAALCANAADVEPILHSFQDKELLRLGVRDLLGKNPVAETAAGLSDLAETILAQVVALQAPALAPKYGEPTLPDGSPCRFAVLALGKLGGREMIYHSDLDLVFVYEGEGRTRGGAETDNQHYFSELARRTIRILTQHGPMGRLYSVDARLRPAGSAGSLAVSLSEFERYYDGGGAQLWERQALTRARTVFGEPAFAAAVEAAARQAAYGKPCGPEVADEVRAMRERLEAGRSPRNLKRGPGGVVDIEFLVQLYQLRYALGHPDLQTPNTRDALDALLTAGLLADADHAPLRLGYDFLRLVESRLRAVTNRATDDLPEDAADVAKLARRLGYEATEGHPAERFLSDVESHTRRVRALFLKLTARGAEVAPTTSA
ncbi:MAG: bifunctional [glutamate--ammonia ligase]-adenylyl-L-tyrosine phosphorylase/[glutamate--ammonia-ligase] adenylyltransferase [Gemmataceae bacterium]